MPKNKSELEIISVLKDAYLRGNKDSLDRLQERYSYGHCMDLAIALHRLYGFKIECVLVEQDNNAWIGHAWVKLPNGKYMDIMGEYSDRIELSSFGDRVIEDLDENELCKYIDNKESLEEDISAALIVAKCLMKQQEKIKNNETDTEWTC